ncbi:MAG: NmrA family NAD(P)-binding protein [Chloroflexota bacterium]
MILITGAAGKTGRAIINALQRSGRQIRAFVRSQVQADLLINLGAGQAFIGDLRSSADLERAVEGVCAVYHICPNMHPDEVAIGQSLISACRGKVERFVFHSVFHPQIEVMPHHWNKLRVEEILIGSGLNFTIFQPTAYMQNVLGQLNKVKRSGVYRIPYNVETRVSMVDLDDVAEAAADSLINEGYFGGTYELVGPSYLSQIEIAEQLSLNLERDVVAEEIPIAEWQQQAEQTGLGEYQINTLTKMFSYYNKFNFMGNSKSLENLLGRKPTSFEGFLSRELPDREIK